MSSFAANYVNSGYESTWAVTIDGRYSTTIQNYLIADGIPEDGVSKIIENAAKTLRYAPNPSNKAQCHKTGLVIGKVQSGKTSNFISLTALAFDNKYDIVVVLGGTKNVLVTQNRDRIKEYFGSAKEVLVLDTVDYKSELTEKKIQQFIKNGRKIVIVALKHPAQINFLKNNIFADSTLADRPCLIVDDEGDEASPNTLVSKGKKSATYSAIENLKNTLDRHCFVSVTATPQANILIDTLDILSPDFGVLVDPGKGYCGLDVFHSSDKYTVEIPKDEVSLLDNGIPSSFIKAISMFFVACAIQRFRGSKYGEKVSMLVHPSQKKADHKQVLSKVASLVEDWKLMSEDKEDDAYADIRDILMAAYNEYVKSGVKNIPSFEQLEDLIIDALNMCGIHEVNGDSVSKSADDIYDYNIYVGGVLLGRGLTLKGLTITYIIRTAKGVSAVDTVQQRARWFGYKTKYLDLCRVFAVPKILQEFRDIRDHEEDLWQTVREANIQGTKFKDVSRIFVLSDSLKMTRQNVANTEKFTFSFWNKQRYFTSDPEYIKSNNFVLNEFRKKRAAILETQQIGGGAPFTIVHSTFEEVYDEILSVFNFPTDSKLRKPLIDKLRGLLKSKDIHPQIDVIWMRDAENSTSKHPVREDGWIPNYSVGRRPQDLSKPAIYRGDDNEFKKPDTMQLQIHRIEDTNTGVISPTLALYLPISIVEKLTNLVIQA